MNLKEEIYSNFIQELQTHKSIIIDLLSIYIEGSKEQIVLSPSREGKVKILK
jgi:hypothetical protein